MAKAAAVVAVVAVASAGCSTIGGDVQRAMDAYQASDLEKGAELCAYLHDRQGAMNQKGYTRYLVNCGLIAYDRGERSEAYNLLRKGYRAWKRGDPAWINLHAVENMKAALTELSKDPPPARAEQPPD